MVCFACWKQYTGNSSNPVSSPSTPAVAFMRPAGVSKSSSDSSAAATGASALCLPLLLRSCILPREMLSRRSSCMSACTVRSTRGISSLALCGVPEPLAGVLFFAPPPTVRVHRFPLAVVPWHWLGFVDLGKGDAGEGALAKLDEEVLACAWYGSL